MVHMYKRMGRFPFDEAIAHIDSVQWEVDTRALQIADRATLLLVAHKADDIAYIEVAKGDVDSYVVLVDTNASNGSPSERKDPMNSALSIEKGRAGFIDQYGRTYGEMEGLFILAEASHLPKKRKRTVKRRRDRKVK